MKLYEYLAAGLKVVTRALPAYPDLDIPDLYTYHHDRQATAVLGAALSAERTIGGRTVAEGHAWESKAIQLAAFLRRIEAPPR